MKDQKPIVPPVKRSRPDEGMIKISSMAQRKRPSIWKTFLVVILIGIAISASLYFLGIIELPKIEDKPTATPHFSETPTMRPSEVHTSTATQTLDPSVTPTITVTSTATPTPTSTATEKPMPFILKGTPQPVSVKMMHPSWNCDSLVIGGQVWDLQDAPLIGKTVHLGGAYGDDLVELFALSGKATIYGVSGYEFVMDNKLIASNDTLWIRLEDGSGMPLSSITYLNISTSCQENLIIINFKQVR
jgi:hypothetical protein